MMPAILPRSHEITEFHGEILRVSMCNPCLRGYSRSFQVSKLWHSGGAI